MDIDLSGRIAIITGASQGLGLEISLAFVKAGASIAMCARNGEQLDDARILVQKNAVHKNQRVIAHKTDISVPDDVYRLLDYALTTFNKIDILVNNAGVYGPMGHFEEIEWAKWEQAISINLLGSVFMCRALIPGFKRQKYGKIIQLSGGGATSPLPMISAYAASKAAIVRFAETLAEELRDYRIDVNCIAPGALNTRLLDQVLDAGPEKVGKDFHSRALKQKKQGGAPLDRGAKLAAFLASSQSDGITGKLISAVWDPWECLSEHINELSNSDVYTIRRIVPKDRGMGWGNDDQG